MIKVGQKVKFNPFKGIQVTGFAALNVTGIGTVVEVYEDHRWFSVEYGEEGAKKRIGFNFADIGVTVRVCR